MITVRNKLPKHKLTKFVYVSVILIILGLLFVYKNWIKSFEAPRQSTPDIEFTIRKDTSLDAVVSDLKYYDFIKDENAFRYALRKTKDTTIGTENSLKIVNNTINKEARYTISQSMTAWQIADILLNKGEYTSCERGCPDSNFNPELLQGGDLAPTIKQKYEYVKSYEDCVNAISRDGGQLSSEQYYERTGIKKCVSPDGREFTKGKEGWNDAIGG
jgi:hypothetical protein